MQLKAIQSKILMKALVHIKEMYAYSARVCKSAFVYALLHLYMHSYICICTLTFVYALLHLYMHSYICICTLTFVYALLHLYMHSYICICTLTFVYAHMHESMENNKAKNSKCKTCVKENSLISILNYFIKILF